MDHFCTVLEAWYAQVDAPFVHVMDLRSIRDCDGALRARVVRHIKDTSSLVAPLHTGTALVISSPWVRLMVKGIMLLAPIASPVTVHDSLPRARAWASAQLTRLQQARSEWLLDVGSPRPLYQTDPV